MKKTILLLALSLTAVACTPQPMVPADPQGTVIYGLTTDGKLATFGSDNASASTTTRAITGLGMGEMLIDLDVRPMDGMLYGMTSNGKVYRIDTMTGASTLVTAPADGVTLNATRMDFNPAVDRTRVFAQNNQNFRVNQTTNPYTPTVDGTLVYGDGTATTPDLVGAAYDNSYFNNGTPPVAIPDGEPATRLFSVDRTNNQLLKHETAPGSTPAGNFSTLRKVGSLGLTLGNNVGFDIGTVGGQAGTDMAYLSNGMSLYMVNLDTGATTLKANLSVTLKSLAVKLMAP